MLWELKENDKWYHLLNDDPVRPSIPHSNRIGKNREVLVMVREETPVAVVCISLQNIIPVKEEELFSGNSFPTTAVFYTIWSYESGTAGSLIFEAVDFIKDKYPSIRRFVTLSPQTEMARKFHLKNGASIYRHNQQTVNYEYKV